MAKNVLIQGNEYAGIEKVTLPLVTGGSAVFHDTSDATASASDIAAGKTAYTNEGLITGTGQLITGSFMTSSEQGIVQTVTLPYRGTGYPLALFIYVQAGTFNSADTDIYNSLQRYAIVSFMMSKSVATSRPTYATSGVENYGTTTAIYKNSTTSSTVYGRLGQMVTNMYSSSDPSGGASYSIVKFKSNNDLSVFIASDSYGLFADTIYRYAILYS